MPRAKVAIGKPSFNDPNKTNTGGHAYKVVHQLMLALNKVIAADIARDNLNELDDDGLTATIDKLAEIQKMLMEERAILRVKSRESKAPEEGSASASEDSEPDSIDKFKRTVQKYFPDAKFDGSDVHYLRGFGFENNQLLDNFLSSLSGNILRYNITGSRKGVWRLSVLLNH